jgi:hypothetical protein
MMRLIRSAASFAAACPISDLVSYTYTGSFRFCSFSIPFSMPSPPSRFAAWRFFYSAYPGLRQGMRF